MIDFTDNDLRKLRECFESLDADGSSSIGVEELEDPLIALGLVDNRQEVQQIVKLVDEDGSQQIEFEEFLKIIRGGDQVKSASQGTSKQSGAQKGTDTIFSFFKKLTTGKLQNDPKE